MYNQNLHLVDNLLRAKGSQGLVRDHPDLPGDESMRLYYATLLGFIMVTPMLPMVTIDSPITSFLALVRCEVLLDMSNSNEVEVADSMQYNLTMEVNPSSEARVLMYLPSMTDDMSKFSQVLHMTFNIH